MDTQFKKGAIELCVLSILSNDDYYGYEIVSILNEDLSVSTNTVYPILRRLTNEKLLANYEVTYLTRKRKYYTLTKLGKDYFNDKKSEWYSFSEKVDLILKRGSSDE